MVTFRGEMMDKEWGIDISGGQAWVTTSHLETWKSQGATFAFIRMGSGTTPDPNFPRFVSLFDTEWTLGGYWWFDPTLPAKPQVEKALQVFETHSLKATWLAMDFEQYWARWDEFWTKKIRHILSPNQLNAFYSEVAERIRASIPNSILYTAPWFVQAYVPQMATWAGRYRLWLALYPYRSRRYATWDEFRKTINVLTPSFPTWGQSWEFWQFADNHSFLPGVPRGVDLNLRRAVQEPLVTSLQPIYLAQVTAYPSLRVRSAPSLNATILDYLFPKSTVQVFAETVSEGLPWAQIDKDRWVCAKYLRRIV